MSPLTEKKCLPCEGIGRTLTQEQVDFFLKSLNPQWRIDPKGHLTRTFKFKNFKEALAFVNAVGLLAEKEQHHPDIDFGWGKATITLFTHSLKGLTENDFILAAKIDQIQ